VLYHLIYPLSEHWSVLNVFRYITFRSAYAMITALLISFLVGPFLVRKLQELQIGETIREEGPAHHKVKAGTPTMGGILILVAVLLPTVLWARLDNVYVQLILITTIWTGTIGFLDDYLKVVKKKPYGLFGRYKILGQLLFGAALGLLLFFFHAAGDYTTRLAVPFLKGVFLELGVFYTLLVVAIIVGTTNAVNLSDGLDGLATGLCAFAFTAFAGLAYLSGHAVFADYLNILYLEGVGELTVYCMAVVGASLGFLWFNAHPAQVFMGDTGALALGGGLGTVAILTKRELLLVVVGGMFVAEALSVIVQVLSMRWRGKRVFLMSPVHHHFELKGWPESKVVIRFWIVASLLTLLSLSTLKLQ
jgi:phospho-N-acetylmuramoyl-pentapeptide-transferase